MPRPDFPRSLREFQRRFADEEACRLYLAASRWPDGYRCPRCGFGDALELPTRLLWRWQKYGRDTPVTAPPRVHPTHPPFTQWFWAAYLITTHTPGGSALPPPRQIGIPPSQTAWTMVQKP